MGKQEDDALYKAVRVLNNYKEIDMDKVRQLLAAGANVNAWTVKEFHRAPLGIAADYGKIDLVKLLLDHGADVNASNILYYTTLHYSALDSHIDIMQLLLDHGAGIQGHKFCGRTPLHNAVRGRQTEAAAFLFQHGADVNAKDHDGATPLHEAAADGKIKTVQLLLEWGAKAHVVNNKGKTPAALARGKNRDAIAELLDIAAGLKLGPQAAKIRAQQNQRTWDEGI